MTAFRRKNEPRFKQSSTYQQPGVFFNFIMLTPSGIDWTRIAKERNHERIARETAAQNGERADTVSYTHLDVYKRQVFVDN